eukprot:TRINITY_DN1675_c0_g1_i1.p1 TRINITY_DN1675_c0_g1~~TRINITY_DN1675_c0_g1_i1.p1  ORF type:complete len:340 (+),score=47.40 TRINITY_DN1675_c0_g1_i1:288-1307(+)
MSSVADVPTIDISPLSITSPSTEENKRQKSVVAAAIVAAAQKTGFFRISGHGISTEIMNQLDEQTYRFFECDDSTVKTQLGRQPWFPTSPLSYRGYFPSSVNGKEGFDMSNPNFTEESRLSESHLHEVTPFPTESQLPGFKQFMKEYYLLMFDVLSALMRGVALGLKLPENYFVDRFVFDEALATLRLNYYPSSDTADMSPVEIGEDGVPLQCETHTDGSVMTILYAPKRGLQIFDNEWLDVPSEPHTFVINTGRCLQRWTNDVLKAAKHRVRFVDERRISIPFFFEPQFGTKVACPEQLLTQGEQPKYPPILYGDYIVESNKTFKEYSASSSTKTNGE